MRVRLPTSRVLPRSRQCHPAHLLAPPRTASRTTPTGCTARYWYLYSTGSSYELVELALTTVDSGRQECTGTPLASSRSLFFAESPHACMD